MGSVQFSMFFSTLPGTGDGSVHVFLILSRSSYAEASSYALRATADMPRTSNFRELTLIFGALKGR